MNIVVSIIFIRIDFSCFLLGVRKGGLCQIFFYPMIHGMCAELVPVPPLTCTGLYNNISLFPTIVMLIYSNLLGTEIYYHHCCFIYI